jgi:putative flippase GtrA
MISRELIRRARKNTLIRYLFVGGTSYVIELGCLLAIYYAFNTSRATATAIAFWIGLLTAFLLQKLVAFRNYQRHIKTITRQGVLYGLLQLWNYIFTVAFVGLVGGNVIVTRTIAQAIFSTWNYFIYKKVIFRHTPDPMV